MEKLLKQQQKNLLKDFGQFFPLSLIQIQPVL